MATTFNTPYRAAIRGRDFKKHFDRDYIKHSVNLLDFYRHELANAKLTKCRWNEGGLCPFHHDNKPGSFRINTETGAFICFACGAKGGDMISFTMAKHGLDFPDALKKLADEWGIS
jgi:DNA primase